MIEWHRFQAYWLRLSAISLIGKVFVDGKAKCAGVRIVCGANDSKFLGKCPLASGRARGGIGGGWNESDYTPAFGLAHLASSLAGLSPC